MVKLEDGSLVPAADLINGSGEDPEGRPLKFNAKKDAAYPGYVAEIPFDDGSGRSRRYSFGFDDTNVRVSMVILDPEGDKRKEEEERERLHKRAVQTGAEKETSSSDTTSTSSTSTTSTKNEQAGKPWTVEKAGSTVSPASRR